MSSTIQSYRDLIVWQKSIDLTVEIYKITKNFPSDEKFELISQIRRSASSIPANIAEGQARNSKKEFIHFLGISRGSLAELETFLVLSEKLGYLHFTIYELLAGKCIEINKMLNALLKSLR